jgi:EpsI family protein
MKSSYREESEDTSSQAALWAVVVAIILLSFSWGLSSNLATHEPVLVKKPFAEFPMVLEGTWTGHNLPVESAIVDKLQVADYLLRTYANTAPRRSQEASRGEEVTLYLAYVHSTSGGAEYHSPKLCLPGAGWSLVTVDTVTVAPPAAEIISINKVLVQKGLDQQMVLYWYQDRDRVLASEYWQKMYSIWDLLVSHRTDGVLIRVSVPVLSTADEAYEEGRRFLYAMWPILTKYMPIPASSQVS